MLWFVWPYLVIYPAYHAFRIHYPNTFVITYERAVFVESIMNGILSTYYGIFCQSSYVNYIVLSHIFADCIYLYYIRPYDYAMVIHHIFTINYLLLTINYFSNPLNSFVLGCAEITAILFNSKLLLKSFNIKINRLNKTFAYSLAIIRCHIMPIALGAEIYKLYTEPWFFSTYNYIFSMLC